MRPRIQSILTLLLLGALATTPLAIAEISAEPKAEKTQPEQGAVVDRPVRNLRVFFDQAPDVDASKLELVGPQGALEVQGLHTMGANDLMARVVGTMPDGEYTAKYKAVTAGGGKTEGEWTFTIKRGSR